MEKKCSVDDFKKKEEEWEKRWEISRIEAAKWKEETNKWEKKWEEAETRYQEAEQSRTDNAALLIRAEDTLKRTEEVLRSVKDILGKQV